MATVGNARAAAFNTPTGQWAQPTHYALHSSATGWDPLAIDSLASRPARPQADDTVEIAANGVQVTITPGNGFPDALLRSLMRLWSTSSISHLSLHTASPTAGNELSGAGYARVSLGIVG